MGRRKKQDDAEAFAALNRSMGQNREHLAKLMQELREDKDVLARASERYARLGDMLGELHGATSQKQRDVFALKIELEGKQRARSKAKGPPTPSAMPAIHGNRSAGPANTRAHLRIPFQAHVTFGGLEEIYSGFAVNISDGGLLVATLVPPQVGRRFAVEFNLSADGDTVRCLVEAVWRSEPLVAADDAGLSIVEVGLHFVAMKPGDKSMLEDFSRAFAESYPGDGSQ